MVGLPDLDGIQAARNIMRAQPVAIVLITSHYDATPVEERQNPLRWGYLIEPLRNRELTPPIELAISRFKDFVSLQEENETLKENIEARKVIERAKRMLMEQKALSEEQAYSLVKKASMNMRKPMVDVAEAVILTGGLLKPESVSRQAVYEFKNSDSIRQQHATTSLPFF